MRLSKFLKEIADEAAKKVGGLVEKLEEGDFEGEVITKTEVKKDGSMVTTKTIRLTGEEFEEVLRKEAEEFGESIVESFMKEGEVDVEGADNVVIEIVRGEGEEENEKDDDFDEGEDFEEDEGLVEGEVRIEIETKDGKSGVKKVVKKMKWSKGDSKEENE